jgi:hypothetical protein
MRNLGPEVRKVAFFGGIYSNYLALEAAIKLARAHDVDEMWALGDFGAFGPYPDRSVEILRENGVRAIQGNYEESLSSGAEDCHCGYTDPKDNHFAEISYAYTAEKTSEEYKRWMGTLPLTQRLTMGGQNLLLCHGSPRTINEFLWQSNTPRPFIDRLLKTHETDLIVCTHTGMQWQRRDEAGRGIINVGALGRPANDGKTNVWFSILTANAEGGVHAEFVPVPYAHERLGKEMAQEGLPPEFIETINTGWWTTCLEVLPAKERAAGRY